MLRGSPTSVSAAGLPSCCAVSVTGSVRRSRWPAKTGRIPLFLDLEEKWYRTGDGETGVLQFVVADPDGYLLRFYEPLPPREA